MADVLHVLSDDQRRGAQVFGWTLAARLAERGVTSRAVALSAGAGAGSRLPVEALGPRARAPRTLLALRAAMGDARITVAHGSSTLAACAMAGLGPGRAFVYRQISDPEYWTRTAARVARVRVAYRGVRHVVALSARSADVLQHRFAVDRGRITVIPNAVDERAFPLVDDDARARAREVLGLPDDRPVLAYVGAIAREKGVLDLLDAARPGELVLMAGSGPVEGDVRRVADDRGLDVRLLGSTAAIASVHAACDVLVLPSWSEQQPAAVLEASLSGRPVVASSVGLLDELVVDGRTGWLVPPRDATALRAALDRTLADPTAARALGRAGRAHVLERFTMERVAARWEELLGGLTA